MKVIESAHQSFPLTQTALSRLSLTPEFFYPDPYNARVLSARLEPPLPRFTPAEITAVGLIGKIFIHLFQRHIINSCPAAFSDLDQLFQSSFGIKETNQALSRFIKEFPTTPFFYNHEKAPEYHLDSDLSVPRHGLYLSAFLVILSDRNPVLTDRDNVFSSPELRQLPSLLALQGVILEYFADQPNLGRSGKDIFEFLSEPSRMHPDSLADQLEFIRLHWADYLDETLLLALLKTLDRIKEETTSRLFGRPSPENPLEFAKASYLSDLDIVKFSDDLDWMPKLILLAKNIFVWLDQLSKQYQRPIFHLSHIPDQELEKLSSWGINGLWMIGLWERSPASQRIKQICGNLDAVPSAYSLYDYQISEALGGESAYEDLLRRAASFNIRLAADMVPNHMGVYSKWTVDHPDWFLALDRPPFPGYTFTGENLSHDPNVSIFIEDHYYDKTDAAVTFKHIDHRTGIERHIYHGNDGTAMPWNDTAQIDFLNPAAREAVIEAILHVARKFPIIRFDAAMTLAKKHIQRLWFPEPGSGGAIPTRSDHGMLKSDFDRLMPEEFWREVVDRVAAEAPDTLLLAEAFWMMEGYFVRSLGMHRVYNSAFMHMLRDEKNQDYRNLIIETLEYDPQILKRYVNFMNNPDEETAIQQFGSDGKYFGTCVLMSTLPGLPMFGHGQIEGYAEKYGMEYRRAYYDERPNYDLVNRHIREIFPLLHKRYLFADVENFYLFDFSPGYGQVDQNVIVYSNRSGGERALVIYHNKWGETAGDIQHTTSINGSTLSLVSALDLSSGADQFVFFRDSITDLEHLISFSELEKKGLHFQLGAYQYKVLLDFHLSADPDGRLAALAEILGGRGTQSIQHSLDELKYDLFAETIIEIVDFLVSRAQSGSFQEDQWISEIESAIKKIASSASSKARSFSFIPKLSGLVPSPLFLLLPHLNSISGIDEQLISLFYAWAILEDIKLNPLDYTALAPFLSAKLAGAADPGFDQHFMLDCLSILPEIRESVSSEDTLFDLVIGWLDDKLAQNFLKINQHNNIDWFNQEASLALLALSFLMWIHTRPREEKIELDRLCASYQSIADLIKKSSYQVEPLLKSLEKEKDHETF